MTHLLLEIIKSIEKLFDDGNGNYVIPAKGLRKWGSKKKFISIDPESRRVEKFHVNNVAGLIFAIGFILTCSITNFLKSLFFISVIFIFFFAIFIPVFTFFPRILGIKFQFSIKKKEKTDSITNFSNSTPLSDIISKNDASSLKTKDNNKTVHRSRKTWNY